MFHSPIKLLVNAIIEPLVEHVGEVFEPSYLSNRDLLLPSIFILYIFVEPSQLDANTSRVFDEL